MRRVFVEHPGDFAAGFLSRGFHAKIVARIPVPLLRRRRGFPQCGRSREQRRQQWCCHQTALKKRCVIRSSTTPLVFLSDRAKVIHPNAGRLHYWLRDQRARGGLSQWRLTLLPRICGKGNRQRIACQRRRASIVAAGSSQTGSCTESGAAPISVSAKSPMHPMASVEYERAYHGECGNCTGWRHIGFRAIARRVVARKIPRCGNPCSRTDLYEWEARHLGSKKWTG
jgi:hypothetical protein